VLKERQVVKHEFFTEVAVGMRQDLSVSSICYISMLDMISQGLNIIKSLFSDEDESPFQAYFTKCLFVLGFQVSLKRWDVWKLLSRTRTAVDHAIQRSLVETHSLCFSVLEINRVVFGVLLTTLFHFLIEILPLDISIICY